MLTIITVVLFALTLVPLLYAGLRRSLPAGRKKLALIVNIASAAVVCVVMFGAALTASAAAVPAGAAAGAAAQTGQAAAAGGISLGSGLGLLAAALSTGLACLGGGIAVASAAAAAIGAISENPKMFGRSLVFVALAEGIVLYGLLISIQIFSKL